MFYFFRLDKKENLLRIEEVVYKLENRFELSTPSLRVKCSTD